MGCCDGPRTGKPFDARDEGPSEHDLCRFGSDTRRCPECETEVYDSATVCPGCGCAIEETGGGGRWMLVAAGAVVVAMAAWFIVPLL